MRTLSRLLTVVALVGALAATTTSAISVNFLENGPEGTPVVVKFNSADWSTAFGHLPTGIGGVESGTFNGDLAGDFGNGHYLIGLFESPGGPVSDWVNVSWNSLFVNTHFFMEFHSDVDGQELQPPGPFDITAVETGSLQNFTIPVSGISLTVGINSETDAVPESGGTLFLLGLAITGTAALGRLKLQA